MEGEGRGVATLVDFIVYRGGFEMAVVIDSHVPPPPDPARRRHGSRGGPVPHGLVELEIHAPALERIECATPMLAAALGTTTSATSTSARVEQPTGRWFVTAGANLGRPGWWRQEYWVSPLPRLGRVTFGLTCKPVGLFGATAIMETGELLAALDPP